MTAKEDDDQTVTLVSPDECRHFEIGAWTRIEDLTPEWAIAIFGRPVYEHWLKTKDDPRPPGTVTVVSIDRGPGHPNSEDR